MPFPEFDPVLFSIGPLDIRWYALAYVAGIVLGWWYANRLARNYCARLLPHVAERRLDKLLSALRYSYRLGAEAKLRHLALQPG